MAPADKQTGCIWIVRAATVLFVVSVAELIIALALGDPDDGANIGAGIGFMSALAAGIAALLGVLALRAARPAVAAVTGTAAVLALALAAQGPLLLAFGIAEELAG